LISKRKVNNRLQVFIAANTAWNLKNFRINLVKALSQKGICVTAMAPFESESVGALVAAGARFKTISIDSCGTDLLVELISLCRLVVFLRKHKCDLILSYTPKVNVYVGIAARLWGLKWFPNVSGVGAVESQNVLVKVGLKLLYKVSLKGACKVFFQNDDDMQKFLRQHLVEKSQCIRIPGSGVDLKYFDGGSSKSISGDKIVFLLFGRLLWEKGVGEYVKAARYIKSRHKHVEFLLVGFVDNSKSNSVKTDDLLSWIAEGVIKYKEPVSDVRPVVKNCDCVVLPSYYGEGVPRSLLEAAAMMRPIITTDLPGCRDAIINGVTGILCEPKNAEDLVSKLEMFIKMTPENRLKMGYDGRSYIKKYFDEIIVLDTYISVVEKELGVPLCL
jgi:glycosyltransferase involved in cell wall biosynthesis